MSTFNTVRFTQLNEEISTLKEKTDLILDVVHLHEKHLHHVEEKLEETNKLLADILEDNVWFSSQVTDAIEKSSNPWSGIMKTLSSQLSITDWCLLLSLTTFWMALSNTSLPLPRKRTWYHLSLSPQTCSKLRSSTFTHRQPTNSP
jgi:hypothetical protein